MSRKGNPAMEGPNPFQALVNLLSNVLDAYTTAYFSYDERNHEFRLVAAHSLSKHLRDELVLPLDGSGILSQVQKVGHIVHLDKVDLEDVSASLPFYREGESHIKGLLAMPVGGGSALLYVDTKRHWGFNDKQRKWIGEVAAVLEQLTGREQCLARQETYSRILQLWHQWFVLGFEHQDREALARHLVDRCARFLRAEFGFLAIRRREEPEWQLLAATDNVPRGLVRQFFPVSSGSLIAKVLREERSLLVPNLNPEVDDHYLISPSENLPHEGLFWSVPSRISSELCVVLSLMAKREERWESDELYAVAQVLQTFTVFYERLHWKDRYLRVETLDENTGLRNAETFEALVDEVAAAALQKSEPIVLALIQFEPWQYCHTKVPPAELRRWQQRIAQGLKKELTLDISAGCLAENRFALLFSGHDLRSVDSFLSRLTVLRQSLPEAKRRGVPLQGFVGKAAFPQEVGTPAELWALAHRKLVEAFQVHRQGVRD